MEAATAASASAPHLLHCGGFGRARAAGLHPTTPLLLRSRQRRLRRVLTGSTEPTKLPPTSRARASAITSTASPCPALLRPVSSARCLPTTMISLTLCVALQFEWMQRFGDVSKEIKRVRKQMEEDEQLASQAYVACNL